MVRMLSRLDNYKVPLYMLLWQSHSDAVSGSRVHAFISPSNGDEGACFRRPPRPCSSHLDKIYHRMENRTVTREWTPLLHFLHCPAKQQDCPAKIKLNATYTTCTVAVMCTITSSKPSLTQAAALATDPTNTGCQQHICCSHTLCAL